MYWNANARKTSLTLSMTLVSALVAAGCVDGGELAAPDPGGAAESTLVGGDALQAEASGQETLDRDEPADDAVDSASQGPITDEHVLIFPASNHTYNTLGVAEWQLIGEPEAQQFLVPTYLGLDQHGTPLVGGSWEQQGSWWVWTEIGRNPGQMFVRNSSQPELYLQPDDPSFWQWQLDVVTEMIEDLQRYQSRIIEADGASSADFWGRCNYLLLTYYFYYTETTFWAATAALNFFGHNAEGLQEAWNQMMDAANAARDAADQWNRECS